MCFIELIFFVRCLSLFLWFYCLFVFFVFCFLWYFICELSLSPWSVNEHIDNCHTSTSKALCVCCLQMSAFCIHHHIKTHCKPCQIYIYIFHWIMLHILLYTSSQYVCACIKISVALYFTVEHCVYPFFPSVSVFLFSIRFLLLHVKWILTALHQIDALMQLTHFACGLDTKCQNQSKICVIERKNNSLINK